MDHRTPNPYFNTGDAQIHFNDPSMVASPAAIHSKFKISNDKNIVHHRANTCYVNPIDTEGRSRDTFLRSWKRMAEKNTRKNADGVSSLNQP